VQAPQGVGRGVALAQPGVPGAYTAVAAKGPIAPHAAPAAAAAGQVRPGTAPVAVGAPAAPRPAVVINSQKSALQ
jgi:hypothetical protein